MKAFYILLFCCFSFMSQAQKFDGSIVVGGTASQIDGDNLAGFNKIGLTGGMRLEYALENNLYAGLEMLYTARGSRSGLTNPGTASSITSVHLNYIEIPLIFGIKDWYLEDEKYYKVGAETGLSYGYLFGASSNDSAITNYIDEFKTSDISYHLGAFYAFTKRWTLNARYTRSVVTLYEDEANDVKALRSYYWSVRAIFRL